MQFNANFVNNPPFSIPSQCFKYYNFKSIGPKLIPVLKYKTKQNKTKQQTNKQTTQQNKQSKHKNKTKQNKRKQKKRKENKRKQKKHSLLLEFNSDNKSCLLQKFGWYPQAFGCLRLDASFRTDLVGDYYTIYMYFLWCGVQILWRKMRPYCVFEL